MPIQFTGCVGRVVWGNPAKPQHKTDQRTGQKILKDGQPINIWSFGVAYPKAEFLAVIWPQFQAEVATGFPHGVPNGFSWKVKDGDTEIDKNGKPLRDREGYAGCYIVNYSTEAFAPPIYKFNSQTGGYDQLTPDQIKTGDFVAIAHNIKVNVETDKQKNSSLFVNPGAVELVGYGKEIISAAAVDPRAAFGGQARALPPGASAAPVLSSGGVGMPGAAPMAPQQPGMPGMMPQAPMQPQQPAGMVPQAPMPGMPGMMPAGQPMAPQPGFTPAPAHDFVQPGMPGMVPGAPMPGMPGMMPQQPVGMVPGAPMPGMMPAGQPMAPGGVPVSSGVPGMPGMMPPR